MSGQVKVERDLVFQGDAKHSQNIQGPMHETMVHYHTHFLEHTLDSVSLTSTAAGASATNTIQTTYVGGVVRMLTSTTDNATQMLSTGIHWEDDKNAVCEARINLADVSGTVLFFGFSDATSETTPALAIDYADATLAAAADNAVGFVCDADDTVNGVSSIVCVGVNATVLETAIDTAKDWEDEAWHVLRVELNPDGDAVFYLDGVGVGYMSTAVASGTNLCISAQAGTRAADGANNVYIDRIDGWQDE